MKTRTKSLVTAVVFFGLVGCGPIEITPEQQQAEREASTGEQTNDRLLEQPSDDELMTTRDDTLYLSGEAESPLEEVQTEEEDGEAREYLAAGLTWLTEDDLVCATGVQWFYQYSEDGAYIDFKNPDQVVPAAPECEGKQVKGGIGGGIVDYRFTGTNAAALGGIKLGSTLWIGYLDTAGRVAVISLPASILSPKEAVAMAASAETESMDSRDARDEHPDSNNSDSDSDSDTDFGTDSPVDQSSDALDMPEQDARDRNCYDSRDCVSDR